MSPGGLRPHLQLLDLLVVLPAVAVAHSSAGILLLLPGILLLLLGVVLMFGDTAIVVARDFGTAWPCVRGVRSCNSDRAVGFWLGQCSPARR